MSFVRMYDSVYVNDTLTSNRDPPLRSPCNMDFFQMALSMYPTFLICLSSILELWISRRCGVSMSIFHDFEGEVDDDPLEGSDVNEKTKEDDVFKNNVKSDDATNFENSYGRIILEDKKIQ